MALSHVLYVLSPGQMRLGQARENYFDEVGMPGHERGRLQLAMLWASQANTIPAAFWTLVHILRSPEAVKVLRSECGDVLKEAGGKLSNIAEHQVCYPGTIYELLSHYILTVLHVPFHLCCALQPSIVGA